MTERRVKQGRSTRPGRGRQRLHGARLAGGLAGLMLLCACAGETLDPEAYEAAVIEWREDRLARLRSESGYLNLAGLYWLRPGENTFGAAEDNDIVFPVTDTPTIGRFVLGEGGVQMLPEPGVDVRYQEIPVRALHMAVIGPSGCGKTTFLHLLAGLIRPSTGTVRILGQDLSQLAGAKLDRFRGRNIGLVFQRFHLLPALNVRDNVLLAQRLAGSRIDAARVATLLEQLDLVGLEHHKPSMLSQGQAQRVAIARALVHGPELIMLDALLGAFFEDTLNSLVEAFTHRATVVYGPPAGAA